MAIQYIGVMQYGVNWRYLPVIKGFKKDEIETILQEYNMNYTDDHKRFKIQMIESQISENEDIFKRIATLNKQCWKSY